MRCARLLVSVIGILLVAAAALAGEPRGPAFGSNRYLATIDPVGKALDVDDYVADLIIAPRPDPNDKTKTTNTLPGDSGTLWCLEQTTEARETKTQAPFPMRFRPLALEWGAQVTSERGAKSMSATSFTLATALSTICRELDVDVVRGWNSGLPEYWGAVGHYTIAAIACQRAGAAKSKLRTLMTKNLERVSYTRATIEKGARAFKGLTKEPFIALADVPDYAWKGGARSGEQPNHFADMDKVVPEGDWEGETLLELCKDPKNVALDVWQEYYKLVKEPSKGILPFRVWQIFNAMTKYAKAKDVARFVAAAGVLAHYVGDACQPLHISYMYDGEPTEDGGKRGRGVHHGYEAVMFNAHVAELWDGIEAKLPKKKLAKVTTGRDAALLTIALMRETFDLIEPSEIVDAYAKGSDLWKKFHARTAKTMANGVTYLTHLWQSAWSIGHGETIAQKKLGTIDEERLTKICDDEKFLPSMRIGTIGEEL